MYSTKFKWAIKSYLPKFLSSNTLYGWSAAIALSTFFLWPVLTHFSSHLTSRHDGVLIAYLITQVGRQLLEFKSIFDLPFYWPHQNTLAFSDPFLASTLVSLPLIKLGINAVVIHNFLLVAGSIWLWAGMFFLCRVLGGSKISSTLGASLLTFGSWHFHYIVHLHTFLIAGLPWCLWGVIKWLEWPHKWQFLAVALLAGLFQLSNAPMTAFFLVATLLPIGLILLKIPLTRSKITRPMWIQIGLAFTLATITAAILYCPYFKLSNQFNYTRTIRDAAHFAHSLNIFWQPEAIVIAVVMATLFLTGKTMEVKSLKSKKIAEQIQLLRKQKLHLYLVTIIIGASLMLGPVLKFNDHTVKFWGFAVPLPYAVLYYVVPGFAAFRASSRWIIVMALGAGLLGSHLMAQSRLKTGYQMAMVVGLLGFWWFTQVPSLSLYEVPTQIPLVYDYLAHQPAQVIAELPAFTWRMMPYNELENDRLFFQLHHHHPLYNGVSGFTPPAREQELDWLWQTFPQPPALDYLHQQQVTLLIVHFETYQDMWENQFEYAGVKAASPSAIKLQLDTSPKLKVGPCFNHSCLYQLAFSSTPSNWAGQ